MREIATRKAWKKVEHKRKMSGVSDVQSRSLALAFEQAAAATETATTTKKKNHPIADFDIAPTTIVVALISSAMR